MAALQDLISEKEGVIDQLTIQVASLQAEVANLTDFQVKALYKYLATNNANVLRFVWC